MKTIISILLALAASLMHGATVSSLTCENLPNPLGIEAREPRLAWKQQSSERGAAQTAWQVLVSSTKAQLDRDEGDLWDSGKTPGAESNQIRYAGQPLRSRQACFWKVRIWDEKGEAGAWSANANWSVGLLPQDWKGEWIGMKHQPESVALEGVSWITASSEVPANTPLRLRKEFDLPKDRAIRRGEFYLGVNGYFACIINGKPQGGGEGWSETTMVDIAPHLQPGINTVELHITPKAGLPFPKLAVAGRIEVHFETGPATIIPTDATWNSSLDGTAWLAAASLGPSGMEPWGRMILPHSRRLAARKLRTGFDVPKTPVRAMLYASGQGLSEYEINGTKVGDHVLSPALSNYDKRVFYVTHDVTAMLRAGNNVIGAHLGNGRFHSPRSRWYVLSRDFGEPRLILQLEIEFDDGTTQTVISDASWKATDKGPITANNEFDGEEYDACLETTGWSRPGFDETEWRQAEVLSAPTGTLCAQMIHPIRVTQTLKPVGMNEPSPGVFVFDMGQNMVGWCRLSVKGAKGDVVKMRHAETLSKDGHLFLANMRSAEVTDTYRLKGGATEIYEPRFTYHGFRYVEITGYPGKPSLDSIEGKVVHDDLPSAGGFTCSEDRINRLHSNIRWGLRGNYRSIPTDCPQRDERQGWLGDRTFSSRGETYLYDTSTLYSKWLQDMQDSQKDNGSIPDVCPNYWPIYTDNVAWPSAAVVIPDMLLDQYADLSCLVRHYPTMEKWMALMLGFISDGLVTRDNYGDWCVPPEDPRLIHSMDPQRKTDPGLVASAYFCNNLRLMSSYAAKLGKMTERDRYASLADTMTAAFNRKYLDPKKGWYDNGTQTSSVLPLAFGLVPENSRGSVFTRLVDNITKDTQGHIGTGLIGGQWLCRTLNQGGRADLVHGLATRTSYPSWGYMIENGATTVWELWNGDTANPAMNSGNHLMLVGDSLIWFYESLAGIRSDPAQPGFKHVLMRPETVDGISFVRANHHSPYGEIRSEWTKEDGTFKWLVVIPPNSHATLEIPCKDAEGVRESGKPLTHRKDITLSGYSAGRAIVRIGAGSYSFDTK